MKLLKSIIPILVMAVTALMLSGCASTDDYNDDEEYSNMPWNTPQQWEGSRSVPGLGGSGGGGY
ncbi:MAG: hypothetical protein V3V05_01790 [Pontiella sp.]